MKTRYVSNVICSIEDFVRVEDETLKANEGNNYESRLKKKILHFTTYFVQCASFGCMNDAVGATADSEGNYLYDTRIHCHEGTINPSAIITKSEWIRCTY